MSSSAPTAARATFTVQQCLPFLAVLVVAALSPALPHTTTPVISWWLLAWALLALLVLACYFATLQSASHWTRTVAPLLAVPVVVFLRAADGYASSGFSPLYFLPVVFFALYGNLRDTLIAIGAALVALVAPILVLGGPQYPASTMRGALLLFIVLAAVGVLISRLVQSSQQTTTRLAASETRFRAAFEDAPVGMALVAVSGPRTGHFLRVNRAMCALLGRSAAELTATPMMGVTHPADQSSTQQWLRQATDPHAAHRIEQRYVHSSGRTVWAAVSFSVVHEASGEPYLIAQIEDEGGRREADRVLLDSLETERAATERMRQLEKVRTELMAGVAHDLRTPLTVAAGFAELLSDETVGELNAEQHQLLDTIARSLVRLGAMVDEILLTARRERDAETKHTPPAIEVDVDGLVVAAIQATSMTAAAKELTISAAPPTGARVLGDANRLDRALVNLLHNAAKFTPQGGRISVRVSTTDDEVVIRIADTGIGIALNEQSRIFERFYRSGAAVSQAISGTGLGLAIVKEIVIQHGGAIYVDSQPGRGATFSVHLPLAPSASAGHTFPAN